MKCPECGSENVTTIYCTETDKLPAKIVNNCLVCGKIWEKEHEPTTAEKLLWLAENKSFEVYRTECGIPLHWETIIEIGRLLFSGNTLPDAIDRAYEFAKNQEE